MISFQQPEVDLVAVFPFMDNAVTYILVMGASVLAAYALLTISINIGRTFIYYVSGSKARWDRAVLKQEQQAEARHRGRPWDW